MNYQTRSATPISQREPRDSWRMRAAHYSQATSHCLFQTISSRRASVDKTNPSSIRRWVPYRRLKIIAIACR